MRRSTIIVSALALLAIGCGARTSPGEESSSGVAAAPTTPAVTTVRLGEPLELTRVILGSRTVATITVASLRANVKSGNPYINPERGQFVAVTVSVQAVEGKIALHQSSFKLVAADGQAYGTTLPIVKPDLGWTDLAPGQRAEGAITFDVPVGAEKGARIALTEWFAKGDAGYWTM